jgi:hypothetical protein
MEGGFFTVIVVFVLTVALSIFPEFSQQFRLLSPIEQALTRAGNGFALAALLVAGLWWLHGVPAAFGDWGAAGVSRPVRLRRVSLRGRRAPVLGLARHHACLARLQEVRHGGVGAWFLWGNQHADIVAGNGPWAWLAWLCLFCVALWWAATGAVRFVLMLGLIGRVSGGSPCSPGSFGSSFFGVVEVLAPVAARDLCPTLLDGE